MGDGQERSDWCVLAPTQRKEKIFQFAVLVNWSVLDWDYWTCSECLLVLILVVVDDPGGRRSTVGILWQDTWNQWSQLQWVCAGSLWAQQPGSAAGQQRVEQSVTPVIQDDPVGTEHLIHPVRWSERWTPWFWFEPGSCVNSRTTSFNGFLVQIRLTHLPVLQIPTNPIKRSSSLIPPQICGVHRSSQLLLLHSSVGCYRTPTECPGRTRDATTHGFYSSLSKHSSSLWRDQDERV